MKYNKNEVTGKMRDRIILQNVTRSRSLTGFASESWSDTTTIWAFAESKLPGSNENIIDGKNTAKNVCDFTIRYISTISEESRVIWGDKLYQVKNIKVSHDRRFISFQGIFYDSYILTGVNVAAAVSGIATSTANIKLLMSVIGQANAIASAIGEIVTAQQGLVEVASSVVANGTSTANVTKVISIDSNIAASANVSAAATIVQFVESSVQAAATSTADVKLTKVLESSVTANATATSAIDVIQQGLVTFEASVTATGTVTADILRIATLESSSNTTADTTANATLTKVLEASAAATAQTSSNAQLTLAVNASATATANTSADASLSYTVNAAADATAQTNADAFITRIISAEATATANSSAEAGIGVTFVAAAVGVATSTSADLFRTATMEANATASGNVTTATVTTVDNVAASVSGAATVNATLNVSLLLDLYPNAAVAYSLRKIRSAYTGSAIRVRRSSDNTEQDIGFSNNNLDETALTTFVGANNGFVVTWYDQSGNGNNALQTIATSQPQIVNNGVIIKQGLKPALRFDGSNDHFDSLSNNPFTYSGGISVIHASYKNSSPYKDYETIISAGATGVTANNLQRLIGFGYGNVSSFVNPSPTIVTDIYSPSGRQFDGTVNTNQRQLISYFINNWSTHRTTGFSNLRFNGNDIVTKVYGTGNPLSLNSNPIKIGVFDEPLISSFFGGDIQEIIAYSSDQNINRVNIENNLNLYYEIY